MKMSSEVQEQPTFGDNPAGSDLTDDNREDDNRKVGRQADDAAASSETRTTLENGQDRAGDRADMRAGDRADMRAGDRADMRAGDGVDVQAPPDTKTAPSERTQPSNSTQQLAADDDVTDDDVTDSEPASLFSAENGDELRGRWDAAQTEFVDDPRAAVEKADGLVVEIIQILSTSFTQERSRLENQWASGESVSTEDLRVALQRYRSFFDRLLSV
jgi:hypothetical protein